MFFSLKVRLEVTSIFYIAAVTNLKHTLQAKITTTLWE